MLKPSDIVDDVRQVFQGLPKGKAAHNRHWVSAYVILARLPPTLRQQLVAQRGAPGEGWKRRTAQRTKRTSSAVVRVATREVFQPPGARPKPSRTQWPEQPA